MKHPNRLRELRLARNVSQSEIARQTGIRQAHISLHETGNRLLTGEMIDRYATYFDVTPYELFVPRDFWIAYDAGDQPVAVAPLTVTVIAQPADSARATDLDIDRLPAMP